MNTPRHFFINRPTRWAIGLPLAPRVLRAVAAVAVIVFALTTPVSAQTTAPIDVVAGVVNERQFADKIEALGTLRANEMVNITALTMERISKLQFDDGDFVKAGAILIEFEHREEQAQLDEARAILDERKAEWRRYRGLAESGAVSRNELDVRQREYNVAAARVQAARAQISDRIIRAPFSGVVGIRTVSVGETVAPGDVITRLADTRVLKLDFSVPSTFLTDFKPGAAIEARANALDDTVFRGSVASIDNIVDPETRSFVVRAKIPNESGLLRPGLLMSVDIIFNQRRSLAVDEGALIPGGDETFVYVVERDRDGGLVAQRRVVELGDRRVGYVEILKGLSAGDTVVVDGAIKLRPNTPVSLRERAENSGGSVAAVHGQPLR